MPVIKISAFAGEKPLINARLLPDTAAASAANVRLDDGALTPTRKSSYTGADVAIGSRTIYRHGSDWLSWATDVNAAPGPIAEDRLYYTGDGVPKMRVGGTVYPLALAAPTATPVATVSGTGSGDTVSRTYAWTWVTSFGEESAPSPASVIVDWKPGQTVTISGFSATPSGRSITKQRIYRSQTGTSGTYLYLIAERAASAGNYVDNVAVDAFQEVLPSSGWTPPPAGLSGLISMPNGMMAAFLGRDVLFCEPWMPHAWPDRYTMTCDTEVVGLAALGSVLIVMTKGAPYIMSGSHPDSVQSQKLETNFACINARGIVNLGFAVCYPSSIGLVAVGADGSVKLATAQLFSRDDWLGFSPTTIVSGQHAGAYVMCYDTVTAENERYAGAMLINVGAEFVVRSSELMSALFFDENEAALYFIKPGGGNVYRFDDPDASPETYYWQSKQFWTTRPINFGAILVDFDDGTDIQTLANIAAERAEIEAANAAMIAGGLLNAALNSLPLNVGTFSGDALLPFPDYASAVINVYADGVLVRSMPVGTKIERLPGKRTARLWEISVSSNVQVTQIIMAGTIDELRNQL